MMTEPLGISKTEDAGGSNFIIQSNLIRYNRKTTADRFSIKAVHEGTEHYYIDGQYYPLRRDNFIVVCPGQEVEVHIDSPTRVKGICYYWSQDLMHQIFKAQTSALEAQLENPKENQSLYSDEIQNFPIHTFRTKISSLVNDFNFQSINPPALSDYMIQLAEKLVHHQESTRCQLRKIQGVRAFTRKEMYKRLQTGRHIIHDHFQEAVTLEQMAHAAGLSPYYFHRNFRLFFNTTPYAYLNEVRMLKAKFLLDNGHLTKTDVSLQCGFQDPKYFSKAYTKWIIENSSGRNLH
jgi:AraC-like DNA-binding protein